MQGTDGAHGEVPTQKTKPPKVQPPISVTREHAAKLGFVTDEHFEEYMTLSGVRVQYGVLNGMTRERMAGLTDDQVRGLATGLTREQVEQPWFSSLHADAAQSGVPYDRYKDLSLSQVRNFMRGRRVRRRKLFNLGQIMGVRAGLSRDQVSKPWFYIPHATLARRGVSYKVYSVYQFSSEADLSCQLDISKSLTRKQMADLNYDQLKFMHKNRHRLPCASIIVSATTEEEMQAALKKYIYMKEVDVWSRKFPLAGTTASLLCMVEPAAETASATAASASAVFGSVAGAGLPDDAAEVSAGSGEVTRRDDSLLVSDKKGRVEVLKSLSRFPAQEMLSLLVDKKHLEQEEKNSRGFRA